MTIVILLLVCYTRICTDCFSLAISLLFDILYKLHFDNFLLNEDDDDDDNGVTNHAVTGLNTNRVLLIYVCLQKCSMTFKLSGNG